MPVADVVGVAVVDGHGVGDALVAGLAEVDGEGVGVALGCADPLGDAEAEGLGLVAVTQKVGAAVGARIVVFPAVNVLLPPFRKRAAGTTRIPRMTVMTKASAPNSWRQKAHDEFRISLRPAPVVAYYAC